MDGNEDMLKKRSWNSTGLLANGHDAGFWALMFMFMYCYELGVKYVTAYAFSIDNFKRKPEEVQRLMDLMLQKVDLFNYRGQPFCSEGSFRREPGTLES
ncbi:hypothetical protein CRYUN_Cryun07bG0026000 [Craigia yunnanensis]